MPTDIKNLSEQEDGVNLFCFTEIEETKMSETLMFRDLCMMGIRPLIIKTDKLFGSTLLDGCVNSTFIAAVIN